MSQHLLPLTPTYLHFAARLHIGARLHICDAAVSCTRGKGNLLPTQFPRHRIMFDRLTFVRAAVITHLCRCNFFPLQGSLDNISIILLCFPGAPQLSAEALHQEAELEDLLESKVAGGWLYVRGGKLIFVQGSHREKSNYQAATLVKSWYNNSLRNNRNWSCSLSTMSSYGRF